MLPSRGARPAYGPPVNRGAVNRTTRIRHLACEAVPAPVIAVCTISNALPGTRRRSAARGRARRSTSAACATATRCPRPASVAGILSLGGEQSVRDIAQDPALTDQAALLRARRGAGSAGAGRLPRRPAARARARRRREPPATAPDGLDAAGGAARRGRRPAAGQPPARRRRAALERGRLRASPRCDRAAALAGAASGEAFRSGRLRLGRAVPPRDRRRRRSSTGTPTGATRPARRRPRGARAGRRRAAHAGARRRSRRRSSAGSARFVAAASRVRCPARWPRPSAPSATSSIAYETFGDAADPALLLVMGLGTQMLGWHEELCARDRRPRVPRDPLRQPRRRPLDGHARPARAHARPARAALAARRPTTRSRTWRATPSGCSTTSGSSARTSSAPRWAA